MKVEFITEEVRIGDLWSKYEHLAVQHPDIKDLKSQTVDLSDSPFPVLAYDGLKFADRLYKNWGPTLKILLEDKNSIEGLPEHQLFDSDRQWKQLSDIRKDDFILDRYENPIRVLSVEEGIEQDVFDIQVPNGNHYIANGMISHNSALSAQIAYNWADLGEDVTMVPLEMSKKEMTARTMANASNIDIRKILFRKMSEGEKEIYWKKYRKFIKKKKKAGGSFKIFKPEHDMTIEEIMAAVYPLGSRVVVIDYISLLKDVDGDDAWQKLGAVARYCKVYAETHNMIVVLLCQVSDEGLIRYARAIAEHANYAWTFVATSTTREHQIINISQLKARNGRIYDFTLRALLDVMRIRDLELEEKEEIKAKTSKSKDKKGKGKFKDKNEDKPTKKSKVGKDYLKDLSDED